MKILLTGATGTLGSYLFRELLRDGHQVYPLVHRKPVEDGGIYLVGDVTIPGLGIERIPKIDALVHAAGLVSFHKRDTAALRTVNVGGTQHAADLARKLNIPLFHISTAYVCGDHKGDMGADDLDAGQKHRNEYETSKFRAETVIKSMPGLTWTIIRPSILVGDSKVVGIPPLHGLYLAARAGYLVKRWLERTLGLPGLVPQLRLRADPDATLNLIPVDVAARQIADLVHSGQTGVHYAVNPQPPTVRQVCDEAGAALGAKIVPTLEFDPNPAERVLERLLKDLLPYLQGEPVFQGTASSPVATSGIIPPGFVKMTTQLFLSGRYPHA